MWLPKWCQNGSWRPLGPSWAPSGLQEPSREAGKTLPKRSGAGKKLIAISRGPSGEISQRDFTLPGGPGGRSGLHFGRPWGSFWPSFWRLVLKMRKSQILQTVHTKTLIFRVPGGSRAPFLEPKIVTERTWKPRARRSQLRDLQNRCPSALGEPPGPKKNFGSFQKRPRGILERFWQKSRPGGDLVGGVGAARKSLSWRI